MILIVLIPILILLTLPLIKIKYPNLLNHVGIQIGHDIITPLTKIYYRHSGFDFVIMTKHDHKINGYRLLHSEYFEIPFHHPQVGFKLYHMDGEEKKEYPYMPGTPSRIRKGNYVLYKQIKAGLGIKLKEIAVSEEWPIDHEQ
jgi:hypothetical protein